MSGPHSGTPLGDTSNKPRRLLGYPSLAEFIASDHDHSTVVFRRFDRLSARNLLYLQSELTELEAKLDKLDEADLLGSLETKQNARNWESLKAQAQSQSQHTGASKELERVELVLEIRAKMKEYRM
jgi:Skp family chaperone for outer membrane proteins